MKKYFFGAVVAFFLNGCATVHVFGKIDSNEKTVYIPYIGTNHNFLGVVKDYLRDLGWKIKVIDNIKEIQTRGIEGKETNLVSIPTSLARYQVIYGIRHNVISFIDNKTGEEVFNITGHVRLDDFKEAFTQATALEK
jgi:hypothetical protein